MAAVERIAVPAMAPGDRVSEGLAARVYLKVNIWFAVALAEIPEEAIVMAGTSGRARLLTRGSQLRRRRYIWTSRYWLR